MALAGALAAPFAAHAADTVTLYGVLDTGFAYVNNAGGAKSIGTSAGNLSGGRWGVKGTEDLGDGTRVLFTLENGFSTNNGTLGQGSRGFGRQAFVGLQNDRLGTVQIGRQYTPMQLAIGGFTAGLRWATWYNTHPFDADLLGGSTRNNNSINYRTATINGFTASAQYSFSNQASGTGGGFNNNQAYGGALEYANGPLALAFGVHTFHKPNASSNTNGAISGDYQSGLGTWFKQIDTNLSGASSSATWSVDRQTVWSLGGLYKLGDWDIAGVWSTTNFTGLRISGANSASLTATNGRFRLDSYEVSLAYHWGAALTTGVSYTYSYGKLDTNTAARSLGWHSIALGSDYLLSKRTDVYGAVVLNLATGSDNVAQASLGAASSNKQQLATIVGIRHRF